MSADAFIVASLVLVGESCNLKVVVSTTFGFSLGSCYSPIVNVLHKEINAVGMCLLPHR